jgi:acyl CoA:acetate/3-ketoacid CoA transferase
MINEANIRLLVMRFFEITSSSGNTARVPVAQFLRIETFDDYQSGNGVVQVLFRNADEENPFIVTINTTIGTQTSVASRIQGELSEESNNSILIRSNMMPNVTGIVF